MDIGSRERLDRIPLSSSIISARVSLRIPYFRRNFDGMSKLPFCRNCGNGGFHASSRGTREIESGHSIRSRSAPIMAYIMDSDRTKSETALPGMLPECCQRGEIHVRGDGALHRAQHFARGRGGGQRHAHWLARSRARLRSLCIRRRGKLGLYSPFSIAAFNSITPERPMLDCITSEGFAPARPRA